VFERFRQSDSSSSRRHGGLGLGLALVRELVELHGGTVRAESDGEMRGATFTIDLPTIPSPEVRRTPAEARPIAAPKAPSLAGIRVLVVEDEADSRDILAQTLTTCGADVVTAESCTEALGLIRDAARDHLPRVILADLGMPQDDGFDLIRAVRELPSGEGGRIPMIAVTGYANPDDRDRALAAGFIAHLAKPIDPLAVATAVARVARETVV
jgi:hypothetical protein